MSDLSGNSAVIYPSKDGSVVAVNNYVGPARAVRGLSATSEDYAEIDAFPSSSTSATTSTSPSYAQPRKEWRQPPQPAKRARDSEDKLASSSRDYERGNGNAAPNGTAQASSRAAQASSRSNGAGDRSGARGQSNGQPRDKRSLPNGRDARAPGKAHPEDRIHTMEAEVVSSGGRARNGRSVTLKDSEQTSASTAGGCCGCAGWKLWAVLLGVAELFLLSYPMLSTIIIDTKGRYLAWFLQPLLAPLWSVAGGRDWVLWTTVVLIALSILAVICLLQALDSDSPNLVYPHLLMQVVMSLVLLALVGYGISRLVRVDHFSQPNSLTGPKAKARLRRQAADDYYNYDYDQDYANLSTQALPRTSPAPNASLSSFPTPGPTAFGATDASDGAARPLIDRARGLLGDAFFEEPSSTATPDLGGTDQPTPAGGTVGEPWTDSASPGSTGEPESSTLDYGDLGTATFDYGDSGTELPSTFPTPPPLVTTQALPTPPPPSTTAQATQEPPVRTTSSSQATLAPLRDSTDYNYDSTGDGDQTSETTTPTEASFPQRTLAPLAGTTTWPLEGRPEGRASLRTLAPLRDSGVTEYDYGPVVGETTWRPPSEEELAWLAEYEANLTEAGRTFGTTVGPEPTTLSPRGSRTTEEYFYGEGYDYLGGGEVIPIATTTTTTAKPTTPRPPPYWEWTREGSRGQGLGIVVSVVLCGLFAAVALALLPYVLRVQRRLRDARTRRERE